jgi:hypothetical protein
VPAYPTLRMPRKRPQVLGPSLNRSEPAAGTRERLRTRPMSRLSPSAWKALGVIGPSRPAHPRRLVGVLVICRVGAKRQPQLASAPERSVKLSLSLGGVGKLISVPRPKVTAPERLIVPRTHVRLSEVAGALNFCNRLNSEAGLANEPCHRAICERSPNGRADSVCGSKIFFPMRYCRSSHASPASNRRSNGRRYSIRAASCPSTHTAAAIPSADAGLELKDRLHQARYHLKSSLPRARHCH